MLLFSLSLSLSGGHYPWEVPVLAVMYPPPGPLDCELGWADLVPRPLPLLRRRGLHSGGPGQPGSSSDPSVPSLVSSMATACRCSSLRLQPLLCQFAWCCLYVEVSSGPQGMTCDCILRDFLATEEGSLYLVSQMWDTRPKIATTGSCCLVKVILQRTLYVADLGDSCVVLGKKVFRSIGNAYMKIA